MDGNKFPNTNETFSLYLVTEEMQHYLWHKLLAAAMLL